MVGVLNGKKKAFCSGFVVAFLLCGVFGGLVAQPCLAEVGDKGYLGSVVHTNADTPSAGTWFGTPFYLEVDANVTDVHFYVDPYGGNFKFFIYSGDYQSCEYYSDSLACGSGEAWYNVSGLSVLLEKGLYILGCRTESGQYPYKSAGNGMTGTVGFGAAWGSLSPTFNSFTYAVYANYTECDIEGGELELSMGISSWGGLAVSVFLIAICLVLALKSRSWAVNFLFGLGTVGFLGWVFANATVEVYGGWLMYMVLLSAVLALTKGAVLVRASGV